MRGGGPRRRRRAPSLSGLDGWQQSAPRSLTQLRGQIVIIWFFSLSSPPAMSMVPGLRTLQEDPAVQVIGVHSPDYAADADPQRLGLAVARAGMVWPIAMDHRRTVLNRWQADHDRHGWPCTHVLDHEGLVVGHHDGSNLQPIRDLVAGIAGPV